MTTGPGRLTVAAAQAESVPGDVAANVATAVALVTSAADRRGTAVRQRTTVTSTRWNSLRSE